MAAVADVHPELERYFYQADVDNHLPRGFTKSIAHAETGHMSDIRKRLMANNGIALGIMQIKPSTAKDYGVTAQQLYDPRYAIPLAGKILGKHLKEFRHPAIAAAAYNAGEGNVRKFKGVPPFAETRAYIPKVLAALKQLNGKKR
jgi:soluble lytic murein transglycosylase-like protein